MIVVVGRTRTGKVSAIILVRIASLALDPRSNQPVIVLRPLEDPPGAGRLLPIWIGHPEATAILLALEGVEAPRPLTHDLMKNVIETLDAQLERVEITRVDEGTFYAALIVRAEERTLAIDARPSDSIALALRFGAPIFVDEDVIDAAGVSEEDAGDLDAEEQLAEFREFLEHVNPEDFQG